MCYTEYMINRHLEEEEYLMMRQERVERELERRREIALGKIETLVSPTISACFGNLLVSAHLEGIDTADMIIESLKLDKDDLKALCDDDDGIFEDLCEMKEINYGYDKITWEYNGL